MANPENFLFVLVGRFLDQHHWHPWRGPPCARIALLLGSSVADFTKGDSPVNLRIILWTLCLAYVGFLSAGGKNAPSITIVMAAALIGAALGLGLGTMFSRRAVRKHM